MTDNDKHNSLNTHGLRSVYYQRTESPGRHAPVHTDRSRRISDHVVMQTSEHVGLITLDDPDHRNAVTTEISSGLLTAVEYAQSDPDVHALIISGAVRAFCAGADFTFLQAATRDRLHQIYDGFLTVADCALPTIAAVKGPAVGAGLNLALACDVRIVSPSAVLGGHFLKLGVHPGGGATWMLHRAVGPQLTRGALLFGMAFNAEVLVQHSPHCRSPTTWSPPHKNWQRRRRQPP